MLESWNAGKVASAFPISRYSTIPVFHAARALVCTKFGAMEALPTEAEIIQLLQNEDIDLLHNSD
jgi:sugar/nucleoside kinase (ribokinase family)